MTQNILLYYNGNNLYPTPIINYQEQPVSFGYVWGYNQAITLNGMISGITTTGAVISGLTNIFTGQFGTLLVQDDIGNTLYNWSGITVEDITLDSSPYFQGSFINYKIQLQSWGVPSGIMDPENSYSFVQNEDGTVTVNHKISARGVRNSAGAFQNAVYFVQQFTGKDPFANCSPYFVPSGSGALLSLNENINRADGVYSVTEVYKYATGVALSYSTIASMDTSESLGEEFKSITYNVKYQASPIYKNLDSVINSYFNNDIVLTDIGNQFNFNTSAWVKTSYSATVDSGAQSADIKISYLSGINPSGFFDYVVTNDNDLLELVENWKIEGEFRCMGPLDYKLQQLALFMANDDGNHWQNYLTGLIVNTPLFTLIHDSSKKFTQNSTVISNVNQQLAELKLSCTLDMGYEPSEIADLKYSLSATPSRRIYELLPSANIEGSYIIQDLQVCSQPNQEFALSCNTYNRPSGLTVLNGYLNNLTSVYVNSGSYPSGITAFLTDYSWETGTYNVSVRQKWIGTDNGISSILTGLTSIGTDTSPVPTRVSGYNFGY